MMPKLISPSLTRQQVIFLIDRSINIRDRAIIALAVESGLRALELSSIKQDDIHWDSRVIRVLGKGKKEAYAPFGKLTEQYLRGWVREYKPKGNIWGINKKGI